MKIVFMGTPVAAVTSLERLVASGHEVVGVYSQPDKPSGRGNQVAQSPVKQFAIDHGISVFQPKKIRTPEALEQFQSHAADVAVVVAYGRILPATFLNAFSMGAINVHFSLLPKSRGAAPVNWSIVQEERKTGVTTMQMDAGPDTGPILLQRETDIGEQETAIELMQRLALIGADVLEETLANYPSLTPLEQNELAASVAPIMRKEDGLISWMLSARQINARVRGFQPFPTAFSYYKGKRLTIWKATPVESFGDIGTPAPGEILRAAGDELWVFCGGDSILRVEELQLEGKRRVAARDFINGVRPRVGDIIGS